MQPKSHDRPRSPIRDFPANFIFCFFFPFSLLAFLPFSLTPAEVQADNGKNVAELVIETAYRPPSLGRNGAGRDDRRGEMAGDPQHYRTRPQALKLLPLQATNRNITHNFLFLLYVLSLDKNTCPFAWHRAVLMTEMHHGFADA